MISKHLKGDPGKTGVRINSLRNQDMIKSVKSSPVCTCNGKTIKDKSSEKDLSKPAVKSTHYDDTFDMVIVGCLDLTWYQEIARTLLELRSHRQSFYLPSSTLYTANTMQHACSSKAHHALHKRATYICKNHCSD